MLPIFLVVLVDIFGLTLVIPLMAIYAETFGATPLQATMLVSVYAACQLVSGPILGSLSDRYGRKRLLLISQLGTCAGFLLMANAHALWVLYVARIIDGATAGNLSLAQAWISDHTPPERRTKSFAVIGIAFGLGFFIGPAVTGALAQYGLTAPIYLAAAMSALSVLCTAFLLPRERPPGELAAAPGAEGPPLPAGRRLGILDWRGYVAYFRRPVLAGLLLQFFLFVFAFSTFTSGFALFAERRFTWHGRPFSPREIGYLFAYTGFLGILFQGGLIGRLVSRFGDAALVTAGFIAAALAYVGLGVVATVPPLVAIATISAFGNGVLRPTLTSMVSQRAGRHEQGVVLGLTQSLGSVASICAPILAGALLEARHLTAWAWTAAAAAFGGIVAVRWGSGRARAQEPGRPG